MNLPVQGRVQSGQIDLGETVRKVNVVVKRQAVHKEIGVPVDQGRGCLELARLPFHDCASGTVQLGLRGWPVPQERQHLGMDVIKRKSELIRLD